MAENVNTNGQDWAAAERAVKAIASQLDGNSFADPMDWNGRAIRTRIVESKMKDLRIALGIVGDIPSIRAMQTDLAEANRVIGEIRAALAGSVPDIGAPVEECVRTLVAQHRAAIFSADPAPATDRDPLLEALEIQESSAIRAILRAEFPATDDPVVAVRALLKERKEMLAEMARAPDAEDVIAGAAEVQDDHPSAPPPEISAVRLEGAIAAALASLVAVISVSMTDWTRSSELAWIYGVLVGWAPDDIEELRIRFGWGVATSQTIEEHRAAICVAATSP